MLLLGLGASPAGAAEPSPALTQSAAELVRVLNGEVEQEHFFSPAFLGQIPRERVREIFPQLRSSYGKAQEAGASRRAAPPVERRPSASSGRW
jgi:hypothetical protein